MWQVKDIVFRVCTVQREQSRESRASVGESSDVRCVMYYYIRGCWRAYSWPAAHPAEEVFSLCSMF